MKSKAVTRLCIDKNGLVSRVNIMSVVHLLQPTEWSEAKYSEYGRNRLLLVFHVVVLNSCSVNCGHADISRQTIANYLKY